MQVGLPAASDHDNSQVKLIFSGPVPTNGSMNLFQIETEIFLPLFIQIIISNKRQRWHASNTQKCTSCYLKLLATPFLFVSLKHKQKCYKSFWERRPETRNGAERWLWLFKNGLENTWLWIADVWLVISTDQLEPGFYSQPLIDDGDRETVRSGDWLVISVNTFLSELKPRKNVMRANKAARTLHHTSASLYI